MRGTLTGQRYVDDILRLHTLPRPVGSPDLSPVEHVWDHLKRKMPSCNSVHDLELAVQDLWAHLPQDNIRCLINSMPDRVVACIAAGAGSLRTFLLPIRCPELAIKEQGLQEFWVDRERQEMLHFSHKCNYTHVHKLEVSEEFGIAQSVISRLWQRFQDDGNVSRYYITGRPRFTTPNEDRYIWQLLPKKNRRSTASDLFRQLSSATGTTVSRQTVYRRLGHIGLYVRRPVRCVPLTATHSRVRLTWSKEHA
ncbi:transposable element Tc3 transposase [Trichonephila clavipes]|nr:transposable element Tc3 transposase [Trichonephila clavipes]